MKIIISPSKTKKINNLPIKDSGSLTQKEPFYLEITKEIIEKIKTFSVEEIEKKFKLKNEKAQKLLEFYKNYENEKSGNALASYTGVAYKAIKIETFDKSDLESYLVILSALYGILTPYTNVKEYRLDMTNSIFKNKSLYEVWKSSVNEYFEKEDIILNLASKEYSKLVKSDNLIDFEFWNDTNEKLKQISTNSKKMRGFTLNYIVKNRITNINNLKDITLNEYVFNKDMSSEKKFVYVKR